MLRQRPPEVSALQTRAETLLERLDFRRGASGLVRAAEELDRIGPALERSGHRAWLLEQVRRRCGQVPVERLAGEGLPAWLTLVGAFSLGEHAPAVMGILTADGQPVAVRSLACEVAGRLRQGPAVGPLLRIVAGPGDPKVRAAAAGALGEIGGAEAAAGLSDALDSADLPAAVWRAASEALERMA